MQISFIDTNIVFDAVLSEWTQFYVDIRITNTIKLTETNMFEAGATSNTFGVCKEEDKKTFQVTHMAH
jgi:hypothetical protein